jgi:hypothetical protein
MCTASLIGTASHAFTSGVVTGSARPQLAGSPRRAALSTGLARSPATPVCGEIVRYTKVVDQKRFAAMEKAKASTSSGQPIASLARKKKKALNIKVQKKCWLPGPDSNQRPSG